MRTGTLIPVVSVQLQQSYLVQLIGSRGLIVSIQRHDLQRLGSHSLCVYLQGVRWHSLHA